MQENYKRIRVKIIGMDCASCAKVTEKVLQGREGIRSVGVNFMIDTACVEFEPSKISEDSIKKTIKRAGYDSIIEKG